MNRSGLVARVTTSVSSTPGPGAYSPNMSTKPRAPAYTLKGRHDTQKQYTSAPYRSLPSSIGTGPKISLASRHAERDYEQTPGPSYVPPPLGSDAKHISLSFRHKEARDLSADTPGPGAYSYQPKFANDAVKYTLHGRTNDPFTVGSQSPGPAAYTPDYMSVKKRAPSSSLHVRTSFAHSDITPGPGAYSISRDLDHHGSTFHQKHATSVSFSTPGPGAYNPSTSNLNSAPKFTMKSRHETTSRPITAPYRSLPSSIGSGPKISLASRHAQRDYEQTPGPSYVPPAFGSEGKKSSMGIKHRDVRSLSSDNPGPGAYSIQPMFARDAPKSTLHQRTSDPFAISNGSPGPAQYNPDYSTQKPRAPSATMHVRTEISKPDSTPGYFDLGSTLTGPKFTIGRREELGIIAV